ncbi:MAG: DUF2892 domain-containing protein [Gammaproteobacteria bacterium]|nr:DUF2892 domain-containing protein [Gammaproteobacteria bacterium]
MNTAVAAPAPGKREFSVERGVSAFAGFMVLLSVALTYWLHPGFVWLTVFVGVNLFQQAFTGFCPAASVMRRLGLRREAEIAAAPR